MASDWWDDLIAPRDTFAQWIMAFFSIVATGVSVWAIIIVRDTLAINIDAVEQAREANKASWKAVEIARKSAEDALQLGKTEVRGYLSCDSGKFWLRERSIWIEIYLSNRGQSPLYDGKSNGRVGCMGRETSGDMYPLNGGFGAIAASGTTTCMLVKSYSGVSEDDIEQLKSGKGTVYINSRFKWTDVFGQELWAEYAISQHTDIKPEIVGGREFMAADLRAVCTDAWRENV